MTGHYGFVTLISNINPFNPLRREKKMKALIKTVAPRGLNIEDCQMSSLCI